MDDWIDGCEMLKVWYLGKVRARSRVPRQMDDMGCEV